MMRTGRSKEITYNTIGNVVTLFFQWLIIMLIPKITDFAAAGVFSVAISVCSIMNHFATFSLREFQVSDQNTRFQDDDYRVVRLITISISFIGIIPFSLIFGYDTEQTLIIFAYMLYRNFIHYAYVYSAPLQIAGHLDYVGKCMAVEGVFSFTSFMAVYIASENLLLAVFLMAVIGGGYFLASQAIGYTKSVGKSARIRNVDWAKAKELFGVGLPLLLAILAPTIITALPKLIIQYDEGDALAGIFSTLSTPTIIVPTLAISVFAPFIVPFTNIARSGDMKALRKQFTKVVVLIAGFGLVCVVLSLLLQDWAFGTFYGEEMEPYSKYFALLMVGITAYTVGTIGTTVLITKSQGTYAAAASFAALLISIPLFLVMIPGSAVEGASLALVASYFAFGILVALCVYLVPVSKKNAKAGNGEQ
ncbi:MAG: lipopolysaccharide biosynthesis protein [Methanomethylophilus sp.]|jgi:O-antigen/teichoic acid export membrane protein